MLALLLFSWSCSALTLRAETEANPIRKVVTILQDMQKEIEAEGEKEEELFEKFMCYCEGNTDGMKKSAEEASQSILELQSKLEAEKAEKSQLDQELVQHKLDREAATKDLETAASIRAKEHEDYVALTSDQKSNIGAMTGAIAALEKGMGNFLQSGARADRLLKVARSSRAVDDFERQEVLSMLQGKTQASGEILGMLKAMLDEMDGDYNGAIAEEEAAVKGFKELEAAKQAEISAASSAIEAKTARSGALAVAVVTTADDIKDTTSEMEETQAFLANLGAQCATKKKEWAERSKVRAEEIAAISEAIKILNDDDALDLFKKTMSLSQKSMQFIQEGSKSSAVARARAVVGSLSRQYRSQPQLALLQYSLRAKAVDFSKILAQIDGMIKVLGDEQDDDDMQKGFCEKEIAKSEKEQADTEEAIEVSAASIDEMTSSSATLAEEIKTLGDDIKALDKAVAEATEQRKEEHAEFLTFQTESNAAVQLIEKAKNRLFKFYRPTMYKEAPKRELTEEEKILAASGRSDMIATAAPELIPGTTQTVFAQVAVKDDAAPAPPPETWGAYQKKDGKSNGVIGLMEMLAKELQTDITEAEHEEETSQKDYERLMAESQKSREEKVGSITTKEAAKAELDTKLETTKEKKALQETELANIKTAIHELHANCDFLLENYDVRKEARVNEIEGLKNAKSVLSGANFA
jgi:chromosome segregation ATPase